MAFGKIRLITIHENNSQPLPITPLIREARILPQKMWIELGTIQTFVCFDEYLIIHETNTSSSTFLTYTNN